MLLGESGGEQRWAEAALAVKQRAKPPVGWSCPFLPVMDGVQLEEIWGEGLWTSRVHGTGGKDARCPLSAQAAFRGVGAVWGGLSEAQAVERVPSAPAVPELWK